MASRQHNPKSKTLGNKYMLGDEIGKGAYGRVYKGLDLENGDFVAIKQVSLENIPQEDLNIIMQEIDLLKNLNHKNIVKYLGSLKTNSHLHIILEYVENGSLANIIKPNKFGPFPESLAAVYIAQVLEGLVYLHEQGVIHRDIKGANILTTKEGLVKLADFGVATKLTEADVNTHSVVGTPYWMAPEVIEMSGVCAASDIWSVGCTVIELLTCSPPYYELQPMPALFRIVQDVQPPIPEGFSPEITDFLRQCFQKDSIQRPDAKTLLMHPWLQNSRRASPSPRKTNPRHIDMDDDVPSSGNHAGLSDPPGDIQAPVASDIEQEDGTKEPVSVSTGQGKSDELHDGKPAESNISNSVELMKDNVVLTKDPTLVFHEKLSLESSPGVTDLNGKIKHEPSQDVLPTKVARSSQESKNGDSKNLEPESKDHSSCEDDDAFSFPAGRQNVTFLEEAKPLVAEGANGLSRFSDTPGDASLEDLFPIDKRGDHGAEASTSTTTQELRDRMVAQKQKGNDNVPMNGGKLLELFEEFHDNIPGENLFPLQSVEYSKIVAQLKPGESEEVILSACQKLMLFFSHRPEQKQIYVSQNGFLPLMELLELPKNRIICSVLQLINYIVKDNTGFLENACLVGLIPVVMNFAVPDRAKEVRMQASFFLQQLCQASTLTLQMFIACQGIPVLVSFLEPDYAKFSREMVHLAIDGIWQVFKLQHSTPRNDFCRIAAKNGILLRLVNTLHSLNEATRFASISGSGASVTQNGSTPRLKSGQLDVPMLESSKVRLDHYHSSGSMQSLQADADKHHILLDPSASPRFNDISAAGHMERNDNDLVRPQRLSVSGGRSSTDRSPKHIELVSNGHSSGQNDQIRPLLSLLEKEPPSRHVSGQLDYARHMSGLERHESILPLLHASIEKKTNGELDLLMAEFAEVSRQGRENGNLDSNMKASNRVPSMKYGPTASNEGTSTSGAASQTASGVLSGSGVLNARMPGSTTSSGLLAQMVSMSADVAREYLEKVADLLLEFAQADTVVKSLMSSQSLLARLFQMFNKIESPILLKILRCINHLSGDPNCLETLQRTDAIKHLIPILELRDGPLVFQIHSEVLNALFNLCKINKRRQEQAAENGIIPHLMNFVMSDSPLRQYALPLLCDMAHASRNSREQLRAHGGLDVYLDLLEDDAWACTALDSIAVCLAHDNDHRKVEQALLKKEAIQKLVKFFEDCPEQYFVHILDAFLKIITKSSRINTAIATNGLTTLLIARLDHREAIARLTLLKLIKVVYEHHPRPKQLIVENDLPQKLQNLIEERRDGQRGGQQVLVKQMATSLLKALHINTVL
ncbi:MAP3K epsilon protein kinase 1-like isoform X1 [Hordeum vulgare subsp. vulgare]|uniref:MAP3K epsilon protein kinase 1-like isoform X1 n=1 Tax=Hordeum vulgare subsp. vulgare TaxID=112509 RepID=UPI001D1A4CF4|nr:MAP3K epsilon protein kinase 1-like isoform X1 [Hordeum vulgare subsp. vulgare]